jgi:type I restriction enzyme M protein
MSIPRGEEWKTKYKPPTPIDDPSIQSIPKGWTFATLACRLVADLIDKEKRSSIDTDVKGDAYEGLLQKNAEDVKGGAGQYFTPRSLIQAIVDVMKPKAGSEPKERFVICDPACGTGGFLLAAHEFIRRQKLDKSQLRYPNAEQLRGVELVDG